MLVDKINEWINNEEEWFVEFLAEMTEDEKYGDDLSDYYPDVEIDGKEIWLTYEYSTRCGDYDNYYAHIPITDVIQKLRKEKLEVLKNNN